MEHATVHLAAATLDEFIEAYERARAKDDPADLADFLPPADHPLYLAVLRELVRVDLEYGWQRGRPRSLENYRSAFPLLFQDGPSIRDIAFEEYRLRGQAGQETRPEEYHERYGVDVTDWPARPVAPPSEAVPRESELSDGAASVPTAMPSPGQQFLGFPLLEELGRGTFGRVFLARQPGLASRLVALKVSTDLWGESQTLAQLQHTHIVPIYSIHRGGPFQAVVMPYLGSATLADVVRDLHQRPTLPDSGKGLVSTLASRRRSTIYPDPPKPSPTIPARPTRPVDLEKLEGMTYVEAVLSLAAQLADGLAHAHERGILHRDLKPANVLLTDDGQPMLLDFNLSEDTKRNGQATAALMGGTLPYMAPEHLDAFDQGNQTVDARGDIYALGVILYELLTGRLPFAVPRGPLTTVLAEMRKDRHHAPPRLRPFNASISPAVEAIVRHCLEPDVRRRYGTARELEEDLKRQLDHRPLRYTPEPSLGERTGKLLRRHPRWAAAGAVAALAGVALLTLGTVLAVKEVRLARAEARNAVLNATAQRQQFQREMREAQVLFLSGPDHYEPGRNLCAHALDRYQIGNDPAWKNRPEVYLLDPAEQEQLREDSGELLLLWARAAVERSPTRERLAEALALNQRAERCFAEGTVPAIVHAQRAGLLGPSPEAPLPEPTASHPRALALLASEHVLAGRLHAALPLLRQAAREDPQRFTLAIDLAICHDRLDRLDDAVAWYNTSIALSPHLAPLYFNRGIAQLRRKKYQEARADLDKARQLDPRLAADCLLNRALLRLDRQQYAEAIQDLTDAEKHGAPRVRVCLVRARVRERMGDRLGAQRDRAEGLKGEPTDETSWLARGAARWSDDPQAALGDFDEALRRFPRSLQARQNKAYLLAERLGRPAEAILALNDLIAAYPDYAPAWASRAVLRARQRDRAGARQDAQTARALDASPALRYQLAGVYALTSRQDAADRGEALKLLSSALSGGYGLDQVDRDTDLDPIRPLPEFRRLVESARNLRVE